MKIAFFHDTPLLKGENGEMYSNGFEYRIWKRYLSVFDKLIVSTRVGTLHDQDIERYKLSSGEGVEFRPNELYKKPIQFFTQKKKIIEPIKQVIEDVDACIIRLPSVIGILAVKECIKQKKPYLIELVGCGWDALWNYGNIKGKLFAPFMYTMVRNSVKNAKQVMYITEEFLQKRYPTKGIAMVCSNLEIDETCKDVLKKRLDKNFLEKDKIVIGTIGNLEVAYKGQHYMIEALSKLTKKGYKIEYQLVGGGSSERLKRLAEKYNVQDKVIFKGSKSHSEVFEWMDEIDIYIQPSDAEAQGRSLLEAMSRGCPAICSEVGGMVELIEEKYRFKKSNVKEIVEVIEKILSDKLDDLMRKNFEFCNQKFSKNLLNEKRKIIYAKLKEEVNINNEKK